MTTKAQKQTSQVSCTLLVKFISDDNHIYKFDDSWNVTVGNFRLQNVNGDRIKISFSFYASLISEDEAGHKTVLIPHEGLPELQPHLENIDILLDILALQSDIPLAVQDGSFTFSGAGCGSKSNPVTNVRKLHDLTGLIKRYRIQSGSKSDLTNSLRFYRLSQIDKDYNGKAVKLWATLEALYKGDEKAENTICKKLSPQEKKQISKSIISQDKLTLAEKKRLIDVVFSQKLTSKSTLLSKKLKLMSSDGDYTSEDIAKLVAWWSVARNAPSHGERIKRDDENRKDAVDNFEDTVRMLLQGSISPSMNAYIIGHPKDVGQRFWDKDDSTITKDGDDCWIKPIQWGRYLLENMGKYKENNNGPLLYVSHDKVIELNSTGNTELTSISTLPDKYQLAVKKAQKKLK